MDAVMPWAELLALVAPRYSRDETGRKPVGREIILRVYFFAAAVTDGERSCKLISKVSGKRLMYKQLIPDKTDF